MKELSEDDLSLVSVWQEFLTERSEVVHLGVRADEISIPITWDTNEPV